jgi:hypothetical protein
LFVESLEPLLNKKLRSINILFLPHKTGEEPRNDSNYDNYQKARDILDMLEGLLAYAIYNTCISPETIRDSAEESYVNIKRRALEMFNKRGIRE